jgi:hypothetical protein
VNNRIAGIVCLVLVTATLSQSQFLQSYGVKFGVVAARQTWNYTNFAGWPAQTRWGIDVAVCVEAVNHPFFSILGELHYIQKGFLESFPLTTPDHPEGTGLYMAFSPEVDYVSIPLLAKFRMQGGTYSPFVVLGPRLDFLVRRVDDGYQPVLDKFTSVDGGISAGLGLDIRLTDVSRASAEFRYSPDVTDAYGTSLLTVRNVSKEFLLGVSF